MKSTTIAELQHKVEQHQVKGFLADTEAAALYAAALSVSGQGPCLEIGSYCGKSTIFIGSACKQRNSVLFAVDHHRGSEEHQPGEEYHDIDLLDDSGIALDSLPIFRKNIELFDLNDTVVPVVANSDVAVKAWQTPLALAFIDGGHSHQRSLADCLTWSHHVQSGGILAIHDIFTAPEDGGQGPYLGLQAVLERGQFDWRETIDSLAILVRR